MADIFEIVGKFAIEGADKAKKEINDVTNTGEKSSSALSKFGKVMGTVGKGVLAVGGAVSAGSVALVKSVQSSYGELQQNLGGSEAVYGQYASNIQKIAQDAYKNMGMSQSEYLATANKMGSLFQGSGIQQKEALDMTTKAMQRASDVASVMGIDMSMAMESIAGAAKGNFTMMDNLGVAMNATTLESYAMSKGMVDFSWNSATSAEKNALAMQMFLERTEQYAGNFARESTDTISGSIGYLSAAWDDFKAGLGNPTADMARLTNNLASSFGAMVNNIVPIIENIANALPIVLPSIVNAISDLAPTLIQTFTDVITKMIDAIIPLLPTVIPLFVDMIVKIGMALAQNAPLLIDGFVQLITQLTVAIAQNLPALIPIFIDCMVQIAGAIVQNAPIILDAILSIGSNFENGLSPAISACIGLVEVLTGAFIGFKAGAMIQGVVQSFQQAQVALSLFKLETQGASIAQGLLNGQLTIGQTVVGLLTGKITLAEIATALWSKAQAVLNAVMTANPIGLVVAAIGALIAIIGVVVYKLANEEKAIKSVEQAQEDLTKAKEDAVNAEKSYTDAVDRSEDALKKLKDAEKALGVSGQELFDQVQNGTLNYQNMTEQQRECYKAYLENEEAQKALTESTNAVVEARKAETIASLEHQIALAAESGNYDDVKNSIVDAFNTGKISADEARDLIGASMSEMSWSAQKTFMEDIPNDIRNGLDPTKYETTLQQMSKGFDRAIDGVKVTFSTVVNWFKQLPQTISNAVNSMIDYVKQLPEKMSTWLTNTINKVTTFARQFTDKAKEAGTKFLNNLINYVKQLPGKIASWLTNTINKVSNFVSNFVSKAREAGTNFVNNLINYIKGLPGKIASVCSNVISNLSAFVSQMISKAIEAGQGFATNILNKLRAIPNQVVSVGRNIVTGVWNGISGGMGWLLGQLQSWCGSVINAIKGWFGIHSPSRVMRDEVGKPIVEGIAVGIKENSDEVSEEFKKMLDDLQLQKDLEVISEATYYAELEKLRDTYLEKGTKDWWEYTKEIIDYENEVAENEKEALEDLNSTYKQHLQDRESLTSDFYSKLSGSTLYDTVTINLGDHKESYTKLNNWDDELEELSTFENKLTNVQERLKAVFGDDDESIKSMLDVIRSDPFGEGGNLLDAMFNSTDTDLSTFATGYKKYIDESKRITKNAYSDELAELDTNFIQQISEKFSNSGLFENLKNIGENVSESLMDGINSKGDWLKEQILKFCSMVSDTFSVGFNVSDVDNAEFSGLNDRNTLGNYQPDYTNQLNLINDAIDRLIALIGEYLPNIALKMDRPLVVDGDSLAVGISRKMDSQLGKMSISKGRGNV